MIPKIIHYCWFGRNKKSKSVLKCIQSWKKHCPDYKIIEWNEDNFDINCIPFVKEAYEAKKWAFVTDYARLKIIYENGGIYLDTDVEVIKSFDNLLTLEAFAGFEGEKNIATGLGFGAEKGQKMISELMQDYHGRHFSDENCKNLICPIINTDIFIKHGLQQDGTKQCINGVTVFPKEYFNPKDNQTYELNITENTYSIHHYDASWKKGNAALKQKLFRFIAGVIGKDKFYILKNIIKRLLNKE